MHSGRHYSGGTPLRTQCRGSHHSGSRILVARARFGLWRGAGRCVRQGRGLVRVAVAVGRPCGGSEAHLMDRAGVRMYRAGVRMHGPTHYGYEKEVSALL